MQPPLPVFHELIAAPDWRAIDFISDLHLQAEEAATVRAFEGYLARTKADAVFILGDLFEVWVGDDSAAPSEPPSDEHGFAEILHAATRRRPVYFLHGNRDFLIGPAFAAQTGLHLLPDPTVLLFGNERWLLSHGDALCLADTEYQRFRADVRRPEWQRDFLARPLAQRRELARSLRAESRERQRAMDDYADLDPDMTRAWLRAAGARQMIHGHTHRPADHDLGEGLQRHVLSDWDAAAQPQRAEVLQLRLNGGTVALARQPVPPGP